MSERMDRLPWMTSAQWECWQFLARVCYGFQHLQSWRVEPCRKRNDGIDDDGIEYHGIYQMATFDPTISDGETLTRLVLMAHRDRFRVSMVTRHYTSLSIKITKCSREGARHLTHPTLEQAVTKLEESLKRYG